MGGGRGGGGVEVVLYRITGIKGNMSSAESGASSISYPHIVVMISQY